ncbi:MAG: SIMPL domain-containing protein [Acidimicrobiales bacterium]
MSDDDSATTEGGPAVPAAGDARLHPPRERTGVGATASIALVAALVVTGVGFAGIALGHSDGTPAATKPAPVLDATHTTVSSNATITVTGSGTVQGTPDTVSFQIGVNTVQPTATAALSQNNSQVVTLERTLMQHGVTQPDMQTSGLDIYENTNKYGTLTGFTVDDDLNVTMQGISNAGGAIDAAAQAVGNGIQLYGISFSIANQSGLLAAARSRAMQNARTEATQLAVGAGETLGGIVRVTDQENAAPQLYYNGGDFAAASAGVPVDAGRQPISVQVTVVYALNG